MAAPASRKVDAIVCGNDVMAIGAADRTVLRRQVTTFCVQSV
jgi:ABC-type sugar transport system substrate-binding protein